MSKKLDANDLKARWQDFKEHIQTVYEADKKIWNEKGGLHPTYHVAFLCPKCDELYWVSVVCTGENVVEKLRENAEELLFRSIMKTSADEGCPECGLKPTLPIGYIFCAESWSATFEKGEEIETPASEHPDRVEAYTVLANTVFGKAALGQATVENGVVGELELTETKPGNIGGALTVPLPQIRNKNNRMFR